MATKPEDDNKKPDVGDPERELMEWRVALLLSIVKDSGEVTPDMKVTTVTTSHPENPTFIKLDFNDGSEVKFIFIPRRQPASVLH